MPGKAPGIADYKVFAAVVGGKRRYELANEEIARRVAKAQTTKNLRQSRFVEEYATPSSRQQNFKRGVENMAARMGTAEQRRLIEKMDANKLDDLYKKNKFVFDVYFSYGGAEQKGSTVVKSEQNVKNTAFLIEQYERAYGKLA